MSVSNFAVRRVAGNWLSGISLALALAATPLSAAEPLQKTYASPDAASAALFDAARSGDRREIRAVFGAKAKQLGSGDPVLAGRERESFVNAYNEKHELRIDGDARASIVLGKNDWVFPVPLVKAGQGWRFDTAAGLQEIIDRRIGRNELNAVQVLLAIADAQRDYASADRDGDGVREYAQKFSSSVGKFDGLYWPAQAGEPASPLGALAARAVREGYSENRGKLTPYWGYYYRILNGQGSAAKGGSYSYLAGDKMIGGFAVVAYPAEYGASGIKSFIVSHDGTVFEKDLGRNTGKAALAMKQFDPASGWTEATSAPAPRP